MKIKRCAVYGHGFKLFAGDSASGDQWCLACKNNGNLRMASYCATIDGVVVMGCKGHVIGWSADPAKYYDLIKAE